MKDESPVILKRIIWTFTTQVNHFAQGKVTSLAAFIFTIQLSKQQ